MKLQEALNHKEAAVLALQRNAKEDEAALAALRAELAAQKRQMDELVANADNLKQILALALATAPVRHPRATKIQLSRPVVGLDAVAATSARWRGGRGSPSPRRRLK